MTTVTKISARGQVTVPTEVREALGIQADDLLVWDLNEDGSATVTRLASVSSEENLLSDAAGDQWADLSEGENQAV